MNYQNYQGIVCAFSMAKLGICFFEKMAILGLCHGLMAKVGILFGKKTWQFFLKFVSGHMANLGDLISNKDGKCSKLH